MGRLRLVPRARIKHDTVRGIDVLLVPESVLELNVEGGEVVRLCDGTRTSDDIVRAMAARHESPSVADDVRAFLRRLGDRGLLEEV